MSDASQHYYWCPVPPLGEGEDSLGFGFKISDKF